MHTEIQGEKNQRRIIVIALAIVVLTAIVGYAGTYWSMVVIWWRSGTFAHGFVILPITTMLIWRRRHDLVQQSIAPDLWALPVLVVLICVWSLATAVNVQVIQQLVVVLMLPVALWLLAGRKIVMLLLFPLAYLLFMIPLGEFLVPWLQDVTAEFTVMVLRLTGIPVLMEGRFLYLPSGTFEVAEACSGIRYLIATLALGTLYAYLTYYSYYRRLLFILLCLLIPIFANAVRAYGIVMLAHLSDYQLAVGVDHIIYGWLFFGVVILIMFWVGSLFRDKPSVSKTAAIEKTEPFVVLNNSDYKRILPLALTSCFILTMGPVSAAWLDRPISGDEPDLAALLRSKDWVPAETIDTDWKPKFVGPTTEKYYAYHRESETVWMYVAYYQLQQQGRELINSQNKLYGPSWKHLSRRYFHGSYKGRPQWTMMETIVKSENNNKIIWHWYEVGGNATAIPLLAKMYELRSSLLRSKRGAAVVVIAADYDEDEEQARNTLRTFLDSELPAIQLALGSDEQL